MPPRLLIPLAALLATTGVYLFLIYSPEARKPVRPSMLKAPSTAAPESTAELPPPKRPAPESLASDAPPDSDDDASVTDAAVQTHFTYSLGEHRLALRDSKKRVRVTMVLHTDNAVTHREIRTRRKQLVRMIYFLSAHRTEAGMVGDAGEARFLGDLKERFQNVIRTGDVDELVFTDFEIEDPPEPEPEE